MIKTIIERFFKVWGVQFETDLPPEFIVSAHAEQRLLERVRCRKDKIQKLVVKAWYSKSVPIPKFEKTKNRTEYFYDRKRHNRVARECMGYVFIFAYEYNRHPFLPQKVLVTVF